MESRKNSYDPAYSSDNGEENPKAVIDLEDLKCDICLQLPKEGMCLCSKGHSVCTKCAEEQERCPICHVPYQEGPEKKIRNLFLDDLLHKMRFDCVWKKEGCDLEGLSRLQLTEHEQRCIFNPTPVPLCRLLHFGHCDYQTSPKFLSKPGLGIAASYLEHIQSAHCKTWNEQRDEVFCKEASKWPHYWSALRLRSSSIHTSDVMHLLDDSESGNYIGLFTVVRYVDMSQTDGKVSWFVVRISDQPQSPTVSARFTLKINPAGREEKDGTGVETSWNATVMSLHEYYLFLKKSDVEREKMKFAMPLSHIREYYLDKKDKFLLESVFSVQDDDAAEGSLSTSRDSV